MCGGGVVASVVCDLIGGKREAYKAHGELFQEAQEHVVVSRQSVNSSLKSAIFHGHEKEKGDCSEGGGKQSKIVNKRDNGKHKQKV